MADISVRQPANSIFMPISERIHPARERTFDHVDHARVSPSPNLTPAQSGYDSDQSPRPLSNKYILGLHLRTRPYPRQAAPSKPLVIPAELFKQSTILQRTTQRACSNASKVIKMLTAFKSEIIREQQNIAINKGRRAVEDYTLTTLAAALEAGKKLHPRTKKSLPRLASSHDLFNFSETLQELPDRYLRSPQILVEKLVRLRSAIIDEMRDLPQPNYELTEGLTINKCVQALIAEGKLKKQTHEHLRYASSRDLFDSSKILQGISDAELASPKALIAKLVELRPKIVKEQNKLRGTDRKTYALITLVSALIAAGRIKRSTQAFQRYATGRDFYRRSRILQTLPKEALSNPQVLKQKLTELQPQIEDEQRRLHEQTHIRNTRKKFSVSIGTMLHALITAGRLPKSSEYIFHVSTISLFNDSPTLQNIPSEVLNDDFALLRFLFAHRDKIAVEVLRARGKLSPDEFTFPGAAAYYAVRTLVDTLSLAGVIEKKRGAVIANKAGYIDYMLKQRDIVEPELRRVLEIGNGHIRIKYVNKSLFVRLTDKKNQSPRIICEGNIRGILCYSRLFLDDPCSAIRSLFDGAELAFFALFPNHPLVNEPNIKDLKSEEKLAAGGGLKLVPEPIVRDLKLASRMTKTEPKAARKKAVESLQRISEYYRAQESISPAVETYLGRIECLAGWNIDALGNPAVTSSFLPLASLFPVPAPIIAIP